MLALTLLIVLASLGLMMVRPWNLPEAVFALGGAALLLACGAVSPLAAWQAAGQGLDVYLFLAGMMLLAELALRQGVFSWAAGHLAGMAGGSPAKLFTLVYALAVIITVFLSNDATAVVFTPAVAAMATAAKARKALPYLLICAFVANAASFVLPISNPANLVLFGGHMPRLLEWLRLFGLASLAAILVTYALLWLTQRRDLQETLAIPETVPELGRGGIWTLAGLGAAALLLVVASGMGWQLGLLTCLLGVGCMGFVCALSWESPWPVIRDVSWSVLPMVAGLFIMVGALSQAGVTSWAAPFVKTGLLPVGVGLGVLSNIANNLPVGLLAADLFSGASASQKAAALIGVDLGPNLSITGSLATILWMNALRRAGLEMSAWRFLALGAVMMPPALLLALAGLWISI